MLCEVGTEGRDRARQVSGAEGPVKVWRMLPVCVEVRGLVMIQREGSGGVTYV